jgi:hypothetical protein
MRSLTCITSLSLVALIGGLVSCAEILPGETGGAIGAEGGVTSDPGAGGAEDGGRDLGEDPALSVPTEAHTPIEALTVQTGLSDDAPLAGEVVQVYCSVEGLAEGQEPPATSWRIVVQPDGSEAGVQIDGDLLIVSFAGVYGSPVRSTPPSGPIPRPRSCRSRPPQRSRSTPRLRRGR